MPKEETETMYPLLKVLEIAEVKHAAFRQHLYKGILGPALEGAGEVSLASHVSQPMRGAGVIRGGGRFVTAEGAVILAVFFRLVSGGVPSSQALRIAWAFLCGGETGNGRRAFAHHAPRQAGGLFPGPGDTFLAAISCDPSEKWGEGEGFAFVPGAYLTAMNFALWLGLHDEDSAPVCLVNLSELVQSIHAGLEDMEPVAIQVEYLASASAQSWPDRPSDPLIAFLSEYAIRDPWGRVQARDFYRAFLAWYAGWKGAPLVQDGGKGTSAALADALSVLEVRKMKSNGIMTFAGFRWRDEKAAQAFISGALVQE